MSGEQITDVLSEKAEKGSKTTSLNRASRNKSEKDRRDKVNAFINELATLVPGSTPQSKKPDKATILKNTVDFMKVHNDLTVAITRKDTTSCITSDELGQLMFEGYHAFLFVISCSGSFKYLSESIFDLLGYVKDDLVGKNVFDYIHPEDKITLMKQISPDNWTGVTRIPGTSSFYIRCKANIEENPCYKTLRCCGNFRTVKEDETYFVVLAKIIHANHVRNVSKWLTVDSEFTSRQSLDGKFLYLDPRCIPVTGYLPYEILGSMIYEYVHFDDLERIRINFEALLEKGVNETEDYRILTKGSQWIVIKTTSYISYNHWNSKPEFMCSTHQLVRTSTLSSRKQASDGVTNETHSTAVGNDHVNTQQNYQAFAPSSGRVVVTSPRECPESGGNEPNLIGDSQMPSLGTTTANNHQSSTDARFWSGQQLAEKFQNPLTPILQTRPQSTDRFSSPHGISTNMMTGGHLPPSRGLSPAYSDRPQLSNPPSMWQNGVHTQTSTNTPTEFPRTSSQILPDCYPLSPPESNFQSPKQKISSVSQASSRLQSAYGTIENPLSPALSPHVTTEAINQQYLARYTTTSSGMITPSSPRILSQSPQSHIADELGSLSSLSSSSISPQPRTMHGYSAQHLPQSSQITDGYPKSPAFTPLSSHSPSLYARPQTSVNSNQSPSHYSSLSQPVMPAYQQSPESVHHISSTTNDVFPAVSSSWQAGYPHFLQSNTNYPSSTYDYPDRALQTPTTPTERYQQSSVSPRSTPHNAINHPKSPQGNQLRSPVLPPPVRHNVLSDHSTPTASPLSPVVIDNTAQFAVPSQRQHMTSIDHQSYFKKSSDVSLQPCQMQSNHPPQSPHTASSLLAEALNKNDQFQEHLGKSKEALFSSPTRTNEEILQSGLNMKTKYLESQGQQDLINKQHPAEQKYQNYQSTSRATEQIPEARMQNFSNNSMSAKTPVYAKAQRILQNQLLEKQSQLQGLIQKQKQQLASIQQQIIVNAQAQVSLQEIEDLEHTKQLEQQVYDLEAERKEHETRQAELNALFQQRVSGVPAHINNVPASDNANVTVSSGVPQNINNSNPNSGLHYLISSEINLNLSMGIPSKTRVKSPEGSCEFVNRNPPQVTRQANSNQVLKEYGLLGHGKEQPSSHMLSMQPSIQHHKTSPVSTQVNNSHLTLDEHEKSIIDTREQSGSSGNQAKDYFSKFSTSELETFLSSSLPTSSAPDDMSADVGKGEIVAPSTYDSLLLQQKRLLEMQEEQRRQLVRRQQEQLLRLQEQQQEQQRMLHDLHNTTQNTREQQDVTGILPEVGVMAQDPVSLLSHELSDDDLGVVNMLLAEVNPELWPDELFDKSLSGALTGKHTSKQ